MMNAHKLLEKLTISGVTEEELAEKLGMDEQILKQKIRNCNSCFTIKEANQLVEILKLEGREAEKIFFA
ncbi:MAG: XRE family transcriptional regulator [Clostridia bacterium]|nr:XRE family transcriptional regulator [Clostridia bacterium]